MKVTQFLVSVLLCLLMNSLIYAAPVDQLARLLNGFTTYQADFQQLVVNDQQQLQSQSSGTFEIKRPNKFRWFSKAPDNTLVITNGNTLWHYDIDLQQATRQTIKPGMQAQNPAMLLSSEVNHITDHYKVSLAKLENQNWFLLVPKNNQNYKKIYLFFQQNQLTQIIVVNNLDERSLFKFSNVRLNHAIADSEFIFTAPRGVDVDVQK